MANERPDPKRIDEATGTNFVGHEWDGIEELDTPMPRWWLWTFYLTIVWALVYVVLYPAWPLIEKGTEGVLGWTSRGQLAQEMTAADQSRASVREQIAAIDIEELRGNPDLMRQAVAGGAAAFKVNCIQCHGSGAAGSQTLGYPNLNDDDWLWGGDLTAIQATLTTSSPGPVSKTLTPPALRERKEMPSTGTRIDWPLEVASMIWSSISTGKAATSGPPRIALSIAITP